MWKFVKDRLKSEKGLTLVEVLAVVVILAIISAIAIPSIGTIIKNSEAKAQVADAMSIMNAANVYFTDDPSITSVTDAELATAGYLESAGKITSVTVTKATDAASTTIDFTTTTKVPQTLSATLKQLGGATVAKGVITLGDE